jgi:hypothetical protein
MVAVITMQLEEVRVLVGVDEVKIGSSQGTYVSNGILVEGKGRERVV